MTILGIYMLVDQCFIIYLHGTIQWSFCALNSHQAMKQQWMQITLNY